MTGATRPGAREWGGSGSHLDCGVFCLAHGLCMKQVMLVGRGLRLRWEPGLEATLTLSNFQRALGFAKLLHRF